MEYHIVMGPKGKSHKSPITTVGHLITTIGITERKAANRHSVDTRVQVPIQRSITVSAKSLTSNQRISVDNTRVQPDKTALKELFTQTRTSQ